MDAFLFLLGLGMLVICGGAADYLSGRGEYYKAMADELHNRRNKDAE